MALGAGPGPRGGVGLSRDATRAPQAQTSVSAPRMGAPARLHTRVGTSVLFCGSHGGVSATASRPPWQGCYRLPVAYAPRGTPGGSLRRGGVTLSTAWPCGSGGPHLGEAGPTGCGASVSLGSGGARRPSDGSAGPSTPGPRPGRLLGSRAWGCTHLEAGSPRPQALVPSWGQVLGCPWPALRPARWARATPAPHGIPGGSQAAGRASVSMPARRWAPSPSPSPPTSALPRLLLAQLQARLGPHTGAVGGPGQAASRGSWEHWALASGLLSCIGSPRFTPGPCGRAGRLQPRSPRASRGEQQRRDAQRGREGSPPHPGRPRG